MGAEMTRSVGQDARVELAPTASADEVAGLDALETVTIQRPPLVRRMWSAAWPKLMAIAIVLLLWQAVVWAGRWPEYVLPGPAIVFGRLWAELQTAELWQAIAIT